MRENMTKRRRLGLFLLVLCLAAAPVFPAYATKTDINDAKKKIDSLAEEKKKTEQAIKNLEGLKADAAAYVKQLDANLEELNKELTALDGQITAKEQDIETAKQELEEAKQVEAHQYATMKLRIKYMYEKGDTNFIDMLLQSKDITQLLNRAEYITKISEYDRRMMDAYGEAKEESAAKEAKLEEEHGALLELQTQTEAKHASVEQLMNEKQTELKNYESKINTAQGQLSDYEKDMKAQEDKIKKIEAEIKRKEEEARKAAEAAGKKYNTVNIGNIKFIWPSASGTEISSVFGGRESPTEGASTNHQGIDIRAPFGSNILAAADGEVTISTYSYSAGNYIMVNHGGGVSTVYMHCSQLLVSVGEKVKQGQVIAKVGSTGYSTGNHLHFGVRLNGSYVNPSKYVSP